MEIYGEISKVRAAVKAWKKKRINRRIRTDHGLSA